MLHFFPDGMLERYLLFSWLSVFGVLQLIAAHFRIAGLSIPGRHRWQWGYPLGSILLGAAYFWFFGRVQHLIFVPGLAGTELFTIFATSTVLALGTTLTLVSVAHRTPEPPRPPGEYVHFNPGRGTFSRPAHTDPHLGVIAVTGLPDDKTPIAQLTDRLAQQGYVTLYIDLAADGPVAYPEVLARLPAACAYLQNQTDINHGEVVLIGAGAGGDLVLRSAATDPSIAGVVAINPVLQPRAIGLDLLQRLTFWEALRWDRIRRRLAATLTATDCLSQMEADRALLIQNGNHRLPEDLPTDQIDLASVHTHDEAIERIAEWTTQLTKERKHVA